MSDTAPQPPSPQSDSTAGPNPARWWVLGVVGLAQLMVVLDATIVNIALPSAQRALAFSNADRQWIVTGYSLGFGGLLLLGGRLSDLIGRRRMLLIGLAGFAAASAVGGLSQSFGMLLIARGVQGLFGALLAPAALSTLTVTFTDPAERGTAFGIYGAIAGAGGAVGLLVGGILTEYLTWRWCLYVNVAFAVVASAGALRFLGSHARDPDVRLDPPGTVLVIAGLVALVYGLSEADTKSWTAPITLIMIVAGIVLLIAFAFVERRVSHPLLPPRIIADRFRGGSYLAVGLSAIAIFGIFLFLTYYLQQTLGYSPVKSGLAFLPMIGGLIIASTVSTTVLLPRIGPRPLIPGGLVVSAIGMLLLTQIGLHTAYASVVLPGLVLVGLGLGLVFGCAFNMATYGADPEDAGVASAMVNTTQQVGGAIGTALLNTIAASALSDYVTSHGRGPQVLASAAVHSYVVAFWVVVGVFIGTAVLSVIVLPSGAPRLTQPGAEPAPEPADNELAEVAV